MAKITINEFSDDYSFNVGVNSYATVALPITACWGPAYSFTPATAGTYTADEFKNALDKAKWVEYPSTPEGLDAFISAYRGPSGNYRINKDYSYQLAMTLLTAGYNVLVCRVTNGASASGELVVQPATTGSDPTPKKYFSVNAKYPGTFGNNLRVELQKLTYTVSVIDPSTHLPVSQSKPYWNVIVYVIGESGSATAVENLSFVVTEPTDWDLPSYIYTLDSLESNFIVITNGIASGTATAPVADTDTLAASITMMPVGGTDGLAAGSAYTDDKTTTTTLATLRYTAAKTEHSHDVTENTFQYITEGISASTNTDPTFWLTAKNMEWNYTAAYFVYSLLRDKLQYNPNRIISPGWDDQDIGKFKTFMTNFLMISPLHYAIMDAAYFGRCAAGYIDIPKSCTESWVYKTGTYTGYAQRLARATYGNGLQANGKLYVTHCGLFAPWGNYRYTGMSRMTEASPSFLALLIQRAQILNQPIQYEWALPENRHHNLNIGKMQYDVTNTVLNTWQSTEGVGVNVITNIPSLGTNIWGNSTLYEVPPATYQALANLSTRFLMNAVEDAAYKASLSVTFQYNNSQALSNLYSGITPILDTMKNVGAIENYKVKVNPDINGEDYVNANTVIAKVYMACFGVISDVVVDLYALPPNADLSQFGE